MEITIDEYTIARGLDARQARKLIKTIDAYQYHQNCDFTCSIVKMLIRDLERDMTRDEIAEKFGFKENISEKEL
jgi:hypothetical protein